MVAVGGQDLGHGCLGLLGFLQRTARAHRAADDLEDVDSDARQNVDIVEGEPPQYGRPAAHFGDSRLAHADEDRARHRLVRNGAARGGNEGGGIIGEHAHAGDLNEDLPRRRRARDHEDDGEGQEDVAGDFDEGKEHEGQEFDKAREQEFERVAVFVHLAHILLRHLVFALDDANLRKEGDELYDELFPRAGEEGGEDEDDGNREVREHRDPRDDHDRRARGAVGKDEIRSDKQPDRRDAEHDGADDIAHEGDGGRRARGDVALVQIVDLEGLTARAERGDSVVVLPEEHDLDRVLGTPFAR